MKTGNHRQLLEVLGNRGSGRPGSGLCLGYLNPHVYNRAAADPAVGEFLSHCEFVCLDGIGAVLGGSLLNFRPLSRLVMDQVFDGALAAGKIRGTALLLGLSRGEIASARAHLTAAHPSLRIVAAFDGFLPDPEYEGIFREHADVDFVLAGMGSPKSERILLRAAELCRHALCWHVGGGTLRNWAGTKKRAPRLASRMGLEWLHRSLFEPETRIRYALGIPEFAYRLTRDTLSAKR